MCGLAIEIFRIAACYSTSKCTCFNSSHSKELALLQKREEKTSKHIHMDSYGGNEFGLATSGVIVKYS